MFCPGVSKSVVFHVFAQNVRVPPCSFHKTRKNVRGDPYVLSKFSKHRRLVLCVRPLRPLAVRTTSLSHRPHRGGQNVETAATRVSEQGHQAMRKATKPCQRVAGPRLPCSKQQAASAATIPCNLRKQANPTRLGRTAPAAS